MRDKPSRYVSRPAKGATLAIPKSGSVRQPRPRGLARKSGFAQVDQEEIAALGRVCGAFLALHLELIRLSGTRWVQRREGWVSFDRDMRVALGVVARSTYSEAVKRLVDLGFIKARGTPGSRLECRLNPHWAKPKAKVINLAAAKQARGRK
jgi:hypothetical protein